LFSITFFFFEKRTVYEVMWKNIVQPDDNVAHAYCMLDT